MTIKHICWPELNNGSLGEKCFSIHVESDMEKYRYDTFSSKEPETIEWIKSFTDGDVFFDIGANIGVYSLYAASLFPNSKIGAFEADPNNCYRLTENVLLNSLNGRVVPVCALLSDRYSRAKFKPVSDEIGASGGQVEFCDTGINYTQTIDDIVDYSFDFPSPQHVKIDIDGQEYLVLRGMKNTVKYIKSALIEVSSRTVKPVIEMMVEAGFTTENRFNDSSPHSRDRRRIEKIDAENIVFTRRDK